jgi:hypothetical protein
VADAVSAVERLLAQGILEIAQFALCSLNLELVICIHDGNACRVIAAVFKLAQTIDDQWDYLFVSDVSNDSTHIG